MVAFPCLECLAYERVRLLILDLAHTWASSMVFVDEAIAFDIKRVKIILQGTRRFKKAWILMTLVAGLKTNIGDQRTGVRSSQSESICEKPVPVRDLSCLVTCRNLNLSPNFHWQATLDLWFWLTLVFHACSDNNQKVKKLGLWASSCWVASHGVTQHYNAPDLSPRH